MSNTKLIKRVNELFEESIIRTPDEEVLEDVNKNPNPDFQKHLTHIKRLNIKTKEQSNDG